MRASEAVRLTGLALGVRSTRALLRSAGFARTVRLLTRIPPMGRRWSEPDSRLFIDIDRVSGPPYTATCLDRSVLAWMLLRQHRLDPSLRIGVALDADDLDGHAWVEWNGRVVNDEADVAERFAVFDDDPARLAIP